MKSVVWWSLLVVVIATAILAVCAWKFGHEINTHPPNAVQIAAYKLNLDIFKAILAGFVVTMLGFLIPSAVTEARYNFERLKESRAAYSNAKTGLDYLALSLCTAKLAEAHEIVRTVHFHKHQAVLYPEFRQHIHARYGRSVSEQEWDEVTYRKLRNTRILLKNHAQEWDVLTPPQRLNILRDALPDIDELHNKSHMSDYSLSLSDHRD